MRILRKLTTRINIWIILSLFILWLGLSILFVNSFSFSVLSYTSNSLFSKPSYAPLTYKKKIFGEFKAQDDYLGIVSLKFSTPVNVLNADQDRIMFSLKQKGAKSWYYQNVFNTSIFVNNEFFPFGFQPITNSKGKLYVFEIKSLSGNKYNALHLDNENPDDAIGMVSYKYSRKEISRTPFTLFNFVVKRAGIIFSSSSALFASGVYMLPLIFYLLYFLMKRTIGSRVRIKIDSIYLISILMLLDSFIQTPYIFFFFVLLGAWLLFSFFNKVQSSVSFFLTFLFLFISVVLTYKLRYASENIAVWAFIFFLTGILRMILEISRHEKSYISMNTVINNKNK